MVNIVESLACIFVWAIYMSLRIHRSLHIFQLNSYRNDRYLRWAKANPAKVVNMRDALPLVSLVPLLFGSHFTVIILFIIVFIALWLMRDTNREKKKLVYTNRVKRLLVTVSLIIIAIVVVTFYWGVLAVETEHTFVWIIPLMIMGPALFLIVILANIINAPLENGINRHYFRDAERIINQSRDLLVIGITGSYGKTSTKHILQTVLLSQYNVLMTPESYNTKLGVTRTIRSNLRPIHDIFIAEMGAKQPNDIQEICDLVQPKFGIVTAIGEQHLETFKTLDTIKRTKFELIESLPRDGTAFLNKDDENIISALSSRRNQCRTVMYGIDSDGLDYKAINIVYSNRGLSFEVVKSDGSSALMETKLLGKHNIYNILSAVAVASELGIGWARITAAVRKVNPVPHRLEIRQRPGDVTIIDDSFNSNPQGSRMALDVLGSMVGKRILVTPGMVELGVREAELNKQLGSYASQKCNYIILVGDKQTKPLQEGLEAEQFPREQYYIAKDFTDAVQHLNGILEPGCIVLFENDLPDNYNE